MCKLLTQGHVVKLSGSQMDINLDSIRWTAESMQANFRLSPTHIYPAEGEVLDASSFRVQYTDDLSLVRFQICS